MRRLGGQSAIDSINASLSKAVTAETASQGSAQTPSVPAYNGSTVTWSTQPFTDLQLQTVNASTSVSTGSVSAGVVNCTTSVAAPTADIRDLTVTTDHDLTIQAPTGRAVRVAHNGSQNAERVMTVPATDYDSNSLVAGSTYELVHDAALGFRFRLRTAAQTAFVAFSGTGKTFNWGSSVPQNYTIGTGGGSTITIDQITRNGTATLQQSNLTYNANGTNLGKFRIDVDGLYQINAVWRFEYNRGVGVLTERAERDINARIRLNGSDLQVGRTFIERQDNNVTYVSLTMCHVAMLTGGDELEFHYNGSSDGIGADQAHVNQLVGSILRVG